MCDFVIPGEVSSGKIYLGITSLIFTARNQNVIAKEAGRKDTTEPWAC